MISLSRRGRRVKSPRTETRSPRERDKEVSFKCGPEVTMAAIQTTAEGARRKHCWNERLGATRASKPGLSEGEVRERRRGWPRISFHSIRATLLTEAFFPNEQSLFQQRYVRLGDVLDWLG
jgi:hypothetical protein